MKLPHWFAFSMLSASQKLNDPLGSSHPIPWEWVLKTHAEVSTAGGAGVKCYRTPELMSPDGDYIAYSQITLQVVPELHRSRASSQLYVEDLDTGESYPISPSSPMAVCGVSAIDAMQMQGTIAIGIPVSWSKTGDRLLLRQFEGLFCTSDATDYAVVWERRNRRTLTLSPTRVHQGYALLEGWSETYTDRVLFRVGRIGQRTLLQYTVNLSGVTFPTQDERPAIYE
jgi:hypothetical protein